MMVDLNQDQKQKLKRLFENQNYSKFESQIEKLGSIEDLPIYLKMGYAGSKVLNPNSKKNARGMGAQVSPELLASPWVLNSGPRPRPPSESLKNQWF